MDNHTKKVRKIIEELNVVRGNLADQVAKASDDNLQERYHHYYDKFVENCREIKELEEYLVWWEEIIIIDQEEAKRKTEEQESMRRLNRLAEQQIVYYTELEKQIPNKPR